MTLLALDNVAKRFGGLAAVRGVSLDVQDGEILGLIGPNGSGKTTLFNLITGFFRPDSGRILINGHDIVGTAPPTVCKLGIARTFQLVRPFQNLSVLQNVAVGRAYGRQPAQGLQQALVEAHALLELVGLDDRASQPARSLTMVDRKRLELGRALATRPLLLLLDELLAGLNPSEVVEAMELIQRIRISGITIVLVEHVVKAVFGVSDRVVVLSAGEKIAEGPPAAVANDPAVIDAYLGTAQRA